MSVMTLADLKAALKVTFTADDTELQNALDNAEAEALDYMNRTEFGYACPVDTTSSSSSSSSSSSEQVMPPAVRSAVVLLVRAMYDTADPTDIKLLRDAAETKMQPYRCGLGV